MKDQEYILISNRIRIGHAIDCLRACVVMDDDPVISHAEWVKVWRTLKDWQQELFAAQEAMPREGDHD